MHEPLPPQPISRLDERLDDLVSALACIEDLVAYAASLQSWIPELMAIDSPDNDALALAAVCRTMAAVAREVLVLRKEAQQ